MVLCERSHILCLRHGSDTGSTAIPQRGAIGGAPWSFLFCAPVFRGRIIHGILNVGYSIIPLVCPALLADMWGRRSQGSPRTCSLAPRGDNVSNTRTGTILAPVAAYDVVRAHGVQYLLLKDAVTPAPHVGGGAVGVLMLELGARSLQPAPMSPSWQRRCWRNVPIQ